MDQRLRLATAAAVMFVGLGLALFFRRPAGETNLPISLQSDPLVLRKQPESRTLVASQSTSVAPSPRSLLTSPAEPRRLSPTIPTPADQPSPPPELPKTYPIGTIPTGTRWGNSLSQMLPERSTTPATHKIIDGDTLNSLAERYLGSASRAMEIYDANRNVLSQPEILPINAELRIPRADQASGQVLSGSR